jgi:hypothetical protein
MSARSISMSTDLDLATHPKPSSADGSRHWLVAASSLLWLLVAASALYRGLDDDDEWQAAYAIFSLTLTAAAALIGFTVARWGRPATRTAVWSVGVAVLVVAVLSTFVAWATVLWQALLAVAFLVLGLGTDRPRAPLFALAAAQVAAVATFVVGDAIGIGTVDSYGDHPLAAGVAVLVGALLTAAAVWLLPRSAGEWNDR